MAKSKSGAADQTFAAGESNPDSFSGRLRVALSGRTVQALSEATSISHSTIRKYLDGSLPSFEKAAAMAEALEVSLEWLCTGRGAKGRNIPTHDFSGVPSLFADGNDVAMVPRLDIQASAGHGSLVDHEDAVEFLAFPPDWLRRRGINPVAARALTARGDSMEPTIRSGDVLLVDTSWQRVDDNGIYVVVSAGFVLVKRVHPRRDGSLMLISDNTRYPPEDIPVTEVPDFQIAGRVMWFGRTI